MKFKITTFVTASVIFMLSSCNKETTYSCKLINETSYHIKEIKFTCAVDEKSVSVTPLGTSDKFELRYEKRVGRFFTEPLVCITVTEYADSTQTYQNEIGRSISVSKLKKDNELVITYEPNVFNPTDIFRVKRK